MSSSVAAPSRLAETKQKLEDRTVRVGIIGLGYVGLPLALLFADERFPVTGFDIDPSKVAILNGGGSYIVRITPEEIGSAQLHGFRATDNYSQIAEMDVVLICVPTPLNDYHEPDLSYVTETARSIAPHLREGQLIVLESTTYPGTTEEVLVPLLESGNANSLRAARAPGDRGFYVAFSPEREDPGNATVERRDIPKVIGGVGSVALDFACAVYGSIFRRTV